MQDFNPELPDYSQYLEERRREEGNSNKSRAYCDRPRDQQLVLRNVVQRQSAHPGIFDFYGPLLLSSSLICLT
jgi:hypothetical protein